MKVCYQPKKFTPEHTAIVTRANEIIEAYDAQGFTLTLRQLYYQFVARGFLANKDQNYKRLGSIINDARLAGLIAWTAIEDRTRNLRSLPTWGDPAEIVDACAQQFRVDLWDTQPHRVEVWIEKDALLGVIEDICNEYGVPFFSCRGYTSQSEMWGAAMRVVKRAQTKPAQHRPFGRKKKPTPTGQRTIVLHFGDHDPSGIDMTRDIEDRISMFCDHHGAAGMFELRRLALNMEQVEQYNPPPNPAKVTDARFVGYQRIHGDESWELDALEPAVLAALIRDEIEELIDHERFDERKEAQAEHRAHLEKVSSRWADVTARIEDDTL